MELKNQHTLTILYFQVCTGCFIYLPWGPSEQHGAAGAAPQPDLTARLLWAGPQASQAGPRQAEHRFTDQVRELVRECPGPKTEIPKPQVPELEVSRHPGCCCRRRAGRIRQAADIADSTCRSQNSTQPRPGHWLSHGKGQLACRGQV